MNILNKPAFATPDHITIDQFFPLICSESHRHAVIWQNRPNYEHVWRVFDCAKTIIEDWDCDFAEMGKTDDFFLQCQPMYDDWRWELVDPLEVELQAGNLINGHHRSFVLGCLLLKDKVDFQPLPVLDLERLHFEMNSEKSIEVFYSAQEFLQYFKPIPGGVPIGEIPQKLRLQNIEIYMETLNNSAQTWKGLSKSENSADRFVRAKMDSVRRDTFMFDSLIIEPADRVAAIAAAFLADAGVNNIETGKTSFFSINPNPHPNQVGLSFTPFSPTIKIPPPYLHETILGGWRMKRILQFLFATYLFSLGFRKASVIAAALKIHPIFICNWAKTPYWSFFLRFWGYTGKEKVTGTTRWEKKHIAKIQKERLEKLKSELLRQNGVLPNDLNAAETQWKKMILKGDL